MFDGHPGILQTEFSCESNCKTEFSQAFMARNVKERGFLVDHLMDLIQRCARSPIPKTWTERSCVQVGEKKRWSRMETVLNMNS